MEKPGNPADTLGRIFLAILFASLTRIASYAGYQSIVDTIGPTP